MKAIARGSLNRRFGDRRSARSKGAALAFAIGATFAIPTASIADESGVSFWLPGLFGSLAAVPQQPGWSLTVMNYYTSVSGGGDVAAAREITIGKFNPTVNVNLNVNLNAHAESI
ncbi:MAG: hypothetical protein ACLQFW_24935 [Xanthobacteraceae bacterium]